MPATWRDQLTSELANKVNMNVLRLKIWKNSLGPNFFGGSRQEVHILCQDISLRAKSSNPEK